MFGKLTMQIFQNWCSGNVKEHVVICEGGETNPITKEVPAVATQAGMLQPPEPATMSLISVWWRLELFCIWQRQQQSTWYKHETR